MAKRSKRARRTEKQGTTVVRASPQIKGSLYDLTAKLTPVLVSAQ
jgi:hypothetical protein